MTENVNSNENYVEDIFDEGKKKMPKQESVRKTEFNEKNYLNTRLGENETEREFNVRIILTKDIDGRDKVAIPIETHSIMLNDKQQKAKTISKSKFKSFICLNDPHLTQNGNNHDGCPLCQKKSELFAEAESTSTKGSAEWKAICKNAYKYESKTTYIVRCIERGKEDEGVKFWRFNKRDDGSGIYDQLLDIAKLYLKHNIRVYDYETGYDIVVKLTKDVDPTPGAPDKTIVKVQADVLPSRLAETQEEIDAIVNDPKDWRDMYSAKSYDYLKLVADGESPVWDKENQKLVAWVDPEELKKRSAEAEQAAAQELKPTPKPVAPVVENNEVDEELPF